MKIKTYFFIFVLLVFAYTGFTQNNKGSIKVTVVKHNNPKEAVSLANITVYKDSTQAYGTTDTDGNCKIGILPGKHNLKIACKGYQTIIYKNVIVNAEKTSYIILGLRADSTNTKTADTIEYSVPLIDPNTAHTGAVKRIPFPRLFFKFNSLNFDTLLNYRGKNVSITDTNQAIAYIAKYIITNPNDYFHITASGDINEQNPEELGKQRIQKLINLLIKLGVPKDIIGERDLTVHRVLINSAKEIENANTENEKEQLHKANRCVIFNSLGASKQTNPICPVGSK